MATQKITSLAAAGVANTLSSEQYERYDDPGVEPKIENEDALLNELYDIIKRTQEHNFSMHRHAFRGTHVKSQAIVKGTLTIEPNLPSELAQGIAHPVNSTKPHDIAIRFANEPSFLQDDRDPGPRGCGMKIFDVQSPRGGSMDPAAETKSGFLHPNGEETHTQDMTFNNAPLLELTDLPTTVEIFRIRERHFREPEKIKPELEKRSDRDLQLAPSQLPNHHFMAYTMYSQSSYRWGPYIAKYALFPTGEFQTKLAESHPITKDSSPEQHSKWLQEYFHEHDATFDLRVQLCQSLKAQPVEDCSVAWDEQAFPFRTVGKVVLPKGQDVFDSARRMFWDDQMKLNVWWGLEEHRPLGSVNRLRKELYQRSAGFRSQRNNQEVKTVKAVQEIPH